MTANLDLSIIMLMDAYKTTAANKKWMHCVSMHFDYQKYIESIDKNCIIPPSIDCTVN